MKIASVDPDSPLFGYVRPGYRILSLNGAPVRDEIDFRYRTADERGTIRIADISGREQEFQFDEGTTAGLGLTLADTRVRRCKCDCVFCFVYQQPRGMRRSLYVKDDDYRLSFTHGNFITLSNATADDLDRIIEQRLSPLYISVHATDDRLRRCIMRNEKLSPIVPSLRYLTENGITIHTQVVLCPGINDGLHVERTIEQLSELYPGVQTLAVVPVGLTKYRAHLPKLLMYTPEEAGEIIDYVKGRQEELLVKLGSRFVWPADEFYVIAGREFPRHHEYEEMSQFENGVGIAREFITRFNRRRARLRGITSGRRAVILTGYSAYPFFEKRILAYLQDELKLDVALVRVRNQFWGESVTVSGLLTGEDLLTEAMSLRDATDVLVLPPNCLNHDDLFLDNMSLEDFRTRLGRPVVVGRYDFAQTVRETFL